MDLACCRINTNPPHYHAGREPGGVQVFVTIDGGNLYTLLFNSDGLLNEIKQRPHLANLTDGFGPEVEEQLDLLCESEIATFDYPEQAIVIQPFYCPDVLIGIRPLPLHLEDYVSNPERHSQADARYLRTRLYQWVTEGRFVLRIGSQNYSIDSEGDAD
jgi:hypothetical protein